MTDDGQASAGGQPKPVWKNGLPKQQPGEPDEEYSVRLQTSIDARRARWRDNFSPKKPKPKIPHLPKKQPPLLNYERERGSDKPLPTPRKVIKLLREMILEALDAEGGVDWIRHQMHQNPVAYMGLLAKILPMQVSTDNGPVQIVVHTGVPRPGITHQPREVIDVTPGHDRMVDTVFSDD